MRDAPFAGGVENRFESPFFVVDLIQLFSDVPRSALTRLGMTPRVKKRIRASTDPSDLAALSASHSHRLRHSASVPLADTRSGEGGFGHPAVQRSVYNDGKRVCVCKGVRIGWDD